MNTDQIIEEAYALLEKGELKDTYQLIEPLIPQEDPHALYIYSCFSLPEWEETGEEHDERKLELLHICADRDVPKAVYTLAVHYMLGDEVELDEKKAAALFEKGALLGHGICVLTHGLNLYYGLLETQVSKDEGKSFIKKAMEMGVKDAKKEWKKIDSTT